MQVCCYSTRPVDKFLLPFAGFEGFTLAGIWFLLLHGIFIYFMVNDKKSQSLTESMNS